ncbi:hypothetical protein VNO78_15129 [Psophocarpus tetragonolobus]|uniref:Uncharacterized protein n=1 Tax=Psophocarpus tetragonolobus TaxID=3891 RepID=A0AAN9SED6_PSOTE
MTNVIYLWPPRDPLGGICSSSLCNLFTEDLWITGVNLVHCNTLSSLISPTHNCLALQFRRCFNPSIDSFLGYVFWVPNNIQASIFLLLFSSEEKKKKKKEERSPDFSFLSTSISA